MDIETCKKYLDFVATECDRHLRDREISDDELISLIVELERFKERVALSELPTEIKNRIAEIELNYSIRGVERGGKFIITAILTFGWWAYMLYKRQQYRRINALNGIRFDTNRLSQYIMVNY